MSGLGVIFMTVVIFSLIVIFWVKLDPRFKDKAHKAH